MDIYISNLETNFKDEDLKELFLPYGEVASAQIQKDMFTGLSRGFGYVHMNDEEAAQKAIATLNGGVVNGITISVRKADVKPEQKGSYKVGSGIVNQYRFRKNK